LSRDFSFAIARLDRVEAALAGEAAADSAVVAEVATGLDHTEDSEGILEADHNHLAVDSPVVGILHHMEEQLPNHRRHHSLYSFDCKDS